MLGIEPKVLQVHTHLHILIHLLSYGHLGESGLATWQPPRQPRGPLGASGEHNKLRKTYGHVEVLSFELVDLSISKRTFNEVLWQIISNGCNAQWPHASVSKHIASIMHLQRHKPPVAWSGTSKEEPSYKYLLRRFKSNYQFSWSITKGSATIAPLVLMSITIVHVVAPPDLTTYTGETSQINFSEKNNNTSKGSD